MIITDSAASTMPGTDGSASPPPGLPDRVITGGELPGHGSGGGDLDDGIQAESDQGGRRSDRSGGGSRDGQNGGADIGDRVAEPAIGQLVALPPTVRGGHDQTALAQARQMVRQPGPTDTESLGQLGRMSRPGLQGEQQPAPGGPTTGRLNLTV